jgi:tetratricopeptide (TPR) repeat protein
MTSRGSILGASVLLLGGILLASCTAHLRPAANREVALARKEAAEEIAEDQLVRTVAHYATGLSYELNDKPNLALQEFVHAGYTDPSYEPIVIEAARRCLHEQKTDQAVDLLTKAAAQPGASGTIYAWLGLAYAQSGKTEQAIAASRTAIRKAPLSLAAYQNLAQVYLQNNKTNEALKVLDEAARQPADNAGFLLDLADLYLRYGRAQASQAEAIRARIRELLERASDLGSTSPVHLLRLADDYFALGDWNKAEPLYRQLAEEHPDLPGIRSKLTEIYLRKGQKDKASEQLQALIQDDPTNPQAYVFLGAVELENKKYSDAADHFERAIQLDPDLEQVYYDLAGLKLTLKKPKESLACLDKARARFKRSFPMEFYTGVAYGALTNYQEALKYFTSAEAIAKATEPARLNHIFYFQVGSTYERSGDLEEAEKYFRECLKLAPDDAEALNYLGFMWADHGIKLGEARTLIEKAVHLEPDNAAFLDSLAWVLFKLNKSQEALPPLLKAIEHSDEPDPTLYDHLGDIYSALKQYDHARDAWTKALKVEPNEHIQRKLEAVPSTASAPSH